MGDLCGCLWVLVVLPSSSHCLCIADGHANHLSDVNPADGWHASLILVVTQEAALQGTPPTYHIWNTHIITHALGTRKRQVKHIFIITLSVYFKMIDASGWASATERSLAQKLLDANISLLLFCKSDFKEDVSSTSVHKSSIKCANFWYIL